MNRFICDHGKSVHTLRHDNWYIRILMAVQINFYLCCKTHIWECVCASVSLYFILSIHVCPSHPFATIPLSFAFTLPITFASRMGMVHHLPFLTMTRSDGRSTLTQISYWFSLNRVFPCVRRAKTNSEVYGFMASTFLIKFCWFRLD